TCNEEKSVEMLATRVALLCLVLSFAATIAPAKAAPETNKDQECLACHGEAGMKSAAGKSISINPEKHAASAHSILSCKDCHTGIKEFPHPAKIVKVQCATCHADEAKAFPSSAHSALGDAACVTCHGPIHAVKASSEADSAIAPKNIPDTCAKCHSDAGFLSRHKIPVVHPVDSYKQSVHARAVALGKDAATCSSCHGSHDILPATDARSKVNRWKVP